MRFSFSYSTFHLSVAAYKRALDLYLRDAVKHGATLWMNTALSIIPIWSGASHGTFIKLAGKIGASISIMGGTPFANRVAGGMSAGMSNSYARMTIFDGAYVIEYSTTLWHLVYNESHNANANPIEGRLFAKLLKPGPYRFQEQSNHTFEAFANSVRLPSPGFAIKTKQHRVN